MNINYNLSIKIEMKKKKKDESAPGVGSLVLHWLCVVMLKNRKIKQTPFPITKTIS